MAPGRVSGERLVFATGTLSFWSRSVGQSESTRTAQVKGRGKALPIHYERNHRVLPPRGMNAEESQEQWPVWQSTTGLRGNGEKRHSDRFLKGVRVRRLTFKDDSMLFSLALHRKRCDQSSSVLASLFSIASFYSFLSF